MDAAAAYTPCTQPMVTGLLDSMVDLPHVTAQPRPATAGEPFDIDASVVTEKCGRSCCGHDRECVTLTT
jgi:hypothetical protein